MKKLLCIAAFAALVLTGCAKDLQVKTTEKLAVEYGDKLDNDKLYDAKESDEKVKVDKVSGYDSKKVGDQTLKDNVKAVKDPVDGDLKYSDKEIKKSGYYIDKGKLDTKKAGTRCV